MTESKLTDPKIQDPKPVSLSPLQFADPSIHELTAGDIIRMYHNQEAKRKRDDGEEGQRDVPLTFRSAPEGLLSALHSISATTGISKAIITRCLSHHILSWYQNMSQVAELERLHKIVYISADGYPDISRLLEHPSYEFYHVAADIPRTSVRTVSFVMGYLDGISVVLGAPVFKLLLSGLCWSITTNSEGWAGQYVKKYLDPEWKRMVQHLRERVLLFQYIEELLKMRQEDSE